MSPDTCVEFQRELDAALADLKQIQSSTTPFAGPDGAAHTSPIQGADMSIRLYESIRRPEAAKRRYRAAIRALSECQSNRPA